MTTANDTVYETELRGQLYRVIRKGGDYWIIRIDDDTLVGKFLVRPDDEGQLVGWCTGGPLCQEIGRLAIADGFAKP